MECGSVFLICVNSMISLASGSSTTTFSPSSTVSSTQSLSTAVNNTGSSTNSTESSLPIIEIAIVTIGLVVLVFATIRMSQLMRQYSGQNSRQEPFDPVECAICSLRQGVPRHASIFVCYSCHSANFIQRDNGVPVRNFSPSPTSSGRKVSLHKITDTFFKIDKDDTDASPRTIGNGEPDQETQEPDPKASVDGDSGLCTICMDSPADTVMLPCAHGGVCYKCSEELVRKHLLSGGAKCVHCRSPITSLIKLSEINERVAQGVEIELPKAMVLVRKT